MGQDASGTIDATAELDGRPAAAGHVTLRVAPSNSWAWEHRPQLPPRSGAALAPAAGICSSRGTSRLAATSLSQRPARAAAAVGTAFGRRGAPIRQPQARCVRRWQAREAGANSAHGRGPHHRGLSRGARGRRQPGPPDIGGKVTIADASYLNQDYGRSCAACHRADRTERLQLTRLAARDSRSGALTGRAISICRCGAAAQLPGKADQLPGRQQRRSQGAGRCRYSGERHAGCAEVMALTLRRSDFRT